MAFCLSLLHGPPEMTIPILVEPPPLIPGHVVPSLWLHRVRCSISASTFAFTLRSLQPVCKLHCHVVIPSCHSAFLAVMHLRRGQSMCTECGPTASARFFREWVCLWRTTDRARRRVQEANWVATCSKAPLKFVLSNSGGGAHVMPVCHTAITKCLPPNVLQHHPVKIQVFSRHCLFHCAGVSSLANHSLCHVVHIFADCSGSSILRLSSGSPRRRLSKMSCHASCI